MTNVRDLLGHETVCSIFRDRHLNKKLLVNVPDGIYDHVSDQGLGWRMVFINKFMTHIISSRWIDNGGPSDLPAVISNAAFGTYPDYTEVIDGN